MHGSSTGFPQLASLDAGLPAYYSWNFMRSCKWACVLALALLPASVSPAAAEDATLLRVFLVDGTSLVSYGEPARVGDRIVFSMPTAATPNPPLHLVNLAAERVDWERTERYSNAARAAQYVKSQAELDYAELSSQLADALNEVAGTNDP